MGNMSLRHWLAPILRASILTLAAGGFFPSTAGAAARLDLSSAHVVLPADATGPEREAVELLLEIVEARSHVVWSRGTTWPAGNEAVVVVGRESTLENAVRELRPLLPAKAAERGKEGFALRTGWVEGRAVALVAGHDERGVLFGVGRLLRELHMTRWKVEGPAGLDLRTAPRYSLRGHQLGYRPKTNSYDGWSLAEWRRYIHELVLFGVNAIELVPPRTDDDADSPHFTLPPLQMMAGMSRTCAELGLDVWIWFPTLGDDQGDSRAVDAALARWREVFEALPRIDAVFVPGGDPGHTPPGPMLSFLERAAGILAQKHPHAKWWLSPQGFSQEWLDELFGLLRTGERPWLGGLVYGPQCRGTIEELRRTMPGRLALRHYPDITHSRQCQYPVPAWDVAFAMAENRECINPRPRGMATIFRRTQEPTVGFITYSEGCNDDVNKAVWSALGWDPEVEPRTVLVEYSRAYLGGDIAESFADGLLELEQSWGGELRSNPSVERAHERFRGLERTATPALLLNWRFQQGLYRAYCDAYLKKRLIAEEQLRAASRTALAEAPRTGSLPALRRAQEGLAAIPATGAAPDLRARISELAEALFQSIHMQLSVARYRAIDVDRGATLDTIDVPLVDAPWLRREIDRILRLEDEEKRLSEIRELLSREDPGPGGFYDDLGDPSRQPHLVPGAGFEQDPAFLASAHTGFADDQDGPRAWWHHAQSLRDAPLQLRYEGLDPAAHYVLRVTYGGETPNVKISLTANGGSIVHPLIDKPAPIRPVEFPLPRELTASGSLLLEWRRPPGLGRNGRGSQVSEVWLLRR